LADLLIAYLESELCLLTRYGVPWIPSVEDTLATSNSFSSAIHVGFDLDPPHLVSPAEAPPGWESTFDLEPLSRLTSELRHFLLPTSPYSISPVSMFTPLRDILDPTKPDASSASHIMNLVQPKMFCADANDDVNPMRPTSSDGWEPFVWNGEKSYWVSSRPGARIRVEIVVNAGRVAVYYFRSRTYDLGDAHCWVDDNESGYVKLKGHWDKAYSVGV